MWKDVDLISRVKLTKVNAVDKSNSERRLKGIFFAGVSDSTSLRIALIGDFTRTSPNENVVNSTMKLIADALALGKVSDNFRISTDRASSHQLYETVKDWYSDRFEDFNVRKQRVYRS